MGDHMAQYLRSVRASPPHTAAAQAAHKEWAAAADKVGSKGVHGRVCLGPGGRVTLNGTTATATICFCNEQCLIHRCYQIIQLLHGLIVIVMHHSCLCSTPPTHTQPTRPSIHPHDMAVTPLPTRRIHTHATARQVCAGVRDLEGVLGGEVLRVNRFTRYAGDVRGASIHTPSLVKAAASDDYSRIMAARKRGGRREYRVVLLVDVSLSMWVGVVGGVWVWGSGWDVGCGHGEEERSPSGAMGGREGVSRPSHIALHAAHSMGHDQHHAHHGVSLYPRVHAPPATHTAPKRRHYGAAAAAAMEGVVMLVEALNALAIPWALATFGERVTLIKAEEGEWDAAAAYALLSHLTFDQQAGTQDAAAIDLAVDLLAASHRRGASKVFVITDGLGTTGALHLARAQARAEQAGVDVVGLGLGPDRTHVPRAYRRWATAALPCDLPRALERLFAADAEGGAGSAAGAAGAGVGGGGGGCSFAALLADGAARGLSAEEVLGAHTAPVFGDLVRQLGGAAQLKLQHCQPDNLTLDVCFVLDATGSMGAWIEACKVGPNGGD